MDEASTAERQPVQSHPPPLAPPRLGLIHDRSLAEIAVLLAVFSVVAHWYVPAHCTSIWMDHEFSGWVAGAVRHLSGGPKLYADGAHSPMPPLPFALIYVLGGGDPRWITESLLNAMFQGATLLVLYLGLDRHLPRPAALIAALATIPVFISLPKVMLYDSMTQFFVAAAATLATRFVVAEPAPNARRALGLVAAAVAACLLCKQNTGGALTLSIVVALLVVPRAPVARRAAYALDFVWLTLAFAVLGVLLLFPLIDVGGYLHDVWLGGMAAKGGRAVLVDSAKALVIELWRQSLELALPPLLLFFVWSFAPRAPDLANVVGGVESPELRAVQLGRAVACGAASVLGYCLVVRFGRDFSEAALDAALFVALIAVLVYRSGGGQPARWLDALFALFLITLPAALAHNLSISYLRWHYDNNPLVFVVLATLSALAVVRIRHGSLAFGRELAGFALTVLLLQALTSARFNAQFNAVGSATERWPEVSFLRGARQRPESSGMRALVQSVRAFAPDPGDRVLLLPNDPNVEAWFERPRPELACLIQFTDQCWDEYVDNDFERLKRDPPRVIVIGPRNYWRWFSQGWQKGVGTERLIDRVLTELIPQRYSLHSQPISFQGKDEVMDLYRRND